MFLSYFKTSIDGKGGKGIEYLPGGIESGFIHVERGVYRPRLLEIKGRKVARVKEVQLQSSSLTQGDSYILDLGLEIYIFVGPASNPEEKRKVTEVAFNIHNDERGGKSVILRIEDDPTNATFWGALGGYVDPSTLNPGLPDTDEGANFVNKLFEISDAAGEIQIIEVASGKMKNEMLKSEEIYLLHCIDSIYIWVGKLSSTEEKKQAMSRALEYMTKNNIPNDFKVQKVSESVEPSSFTKEFAWLPRKSSSSESRVKPSGTSTRGQGFSSTAVMNVDAIQFLGKVATDNLNEDISAFSESIKIWRVVDFKLEPEAEQLYGQFYSGDSYVLLYSYKRTATSKEESIIYFWQGLSSSTDEKGASALFAKDIDDSKGGAPVQCRVVEGKEPIHFRRLFKGKMILHQGGVPSGFNKSSGEAKADLVAEVSDEVRLYAVHGSTPFSTVAKEITPPSGAAINSEDCFVVLTRSDAFCFKGKHSTPDEKILADNVTTILAKGRTIIDVHEHDEPTAFWDALGGKVEYDACGVGEEPTKDARLFKLSTETGDFKVEEIEMFDQSDLADDAVMLLDAYEEVFVWTGSKATAQEESLSLEFATEYIKAASQKDDRSLNTPKIKVSANNEPILFTKHFVGWDPAFFEKRTFKDPFEEKLARMKAEKESKTTAVPDFVKKVSLRKMVSSDLGETVKVDEAPKPFYSLPKRKPSNESESTAPHIVAAAKGTYDTGKLPPMLQAKLAKPVDVSSVTTSGDPAEEITAELYLPYTTLRDTKKPMGVDVDRKELYLADDVFQDVFKMNKDGFKALPKWKRDAKKKEVGLF
jgi:advillin